MAEKTFYNKSEIDKMFKETKDKLLRQIEEGIVIDNKQANKPMVANKTLSLQIVKSETVE